MQNPSYGYICTKPKSAQSGMESNSEGADGDQHPSTDGYVPSFRLKVDFLQWTTCYFGLQVGLKGSHQ
jgi:hypothetical protein